MIYEHRLHERLKADAAERMVDLTDDEALVILIKEDRIYDLEYCKEYRPDVYVKFTKLQAMK